MIVQPKTRGFICTTAHPVGCEENVKNMAAYAESHPHPYTPKRVLVIGASTGYGLACRVSAAFGSYADTVGVFFERPASGNRTGTAGWYNNAAFEKLATSKNLNHKSINGDAFSKQVKDETIKAVKDVMKDGKIDMVIYSLASPKRTDHEGNTYSSVIKPINEVYTSKTVDFHTNRVSKVSIEPATPSEIIETVKVMGGEDWLLWMTALKDAGVLADNCSTVAFSYIGPSLTHAVYKDGTIGKAKIDLEHKAKEINKLLSGSDGRAFVSVNKAVVTQASSAIPVVPLYIALLFKVMKQKGTHEDCIEQSTRLMERLYPTSNISWDNIAIDSEKRIRLDDLEMEPDVQSEVLALWEKVNSDNVEELSDIKGYKEDFFSLFGFGLKNIDYSKPVDINI